VPLITPSDATGWRTCRQMALQFNGMLQIYSALREKSKYLEPKESTAHECPNP